MEIKPCPHCGGAASLYGNKSRRTGNFFVYVKCNICGATGKTFVTGEDPDANGWENQACVDAVAAWNMRNGAENAAP